MTKTSTLDSEHLNSMSHAIVMYVQERLRSDEMILGDIYPHIDTIRESKEVTTLKEILGDEHNKYFHAAIEHLVEEGAIESYAILKKGIDPKAPEFPDHYYYTGTLDVLADEHQKAVWEGNY